MNPLGNSIKILSLMNSVPIIPKEIAERVSETTLREALARFPVAQKAATFHYLYGGIRNAVFLVKLPREKFVLTIYKPDPEVEQRVKRSLEIFSFLHSRGFPVPEMMRTKDGGLYTSKDVLGARRFVSLHHYIYGRRIFPYREEQIFGVGKVMSRLHHTLREFPNREHPAEISAIKDLVLDKALGTVLHMDLARGNVLFDETGEKITAVLDFEQATWGPPVVDVAKSLAIISKDNRELSFERIKEVFIEGYNSGPEKLGGEDQVEPLVKCFSPEII